MSAVGKLAIALVPGYAPASWPVAALVVALKLLAGAIGSASLGSGIAVVLSQLIAAEGEGPVHVSSPPRYDDDYLQSYRRHVLGWQCPDRPVPC